MKTKLLVFALMLTFLVTCVHSISASSDLETQRNYGYLGYELYYEVNSTKEITVGETTTVKILFITDGDIDDVEIYLLIYCKTKDYYLTSWTGVSLQAGQSIIDSATIQPEEEGEIRCRIDALYLDVDYGDYEYGIVDFAITQARNKTYDELYQELFNLSKRYDALLKNYSSLNKGFTSLEQDLTNLNQSFTEFKQNYNKLSRDYDALNQTYTQLLEDHSELKSKNRINVNELNIYRILTFTFLLIIIILIATTIYLKVRKTRIKAYNSL